MHFLPSCFIGSQASDTLSVIGFSEGLGLDLANQLKDYLEPDETTSICFW